MARLGALLVLLAVFSRDLSGAQALLLPSYYESHMVLQHSQPALFWGIAVSGQRCVTPGWLPYCRGQCNRLSLLLPLMRLL